MENGEKRLKLQNDNFIKIQPEIKKILDDEIIKSPKIKKSQKKIIK